MADGDFGLVERSLDLTPVQPGSCFPSRRAAARSNLEKQIRFQEIAVGMLKLRSAMASMRPQP
jgi:hypothetical protein